MAKSPIPKRIQLMSNEEVQRGYLCNAASLTNQQLANLYLQELKTRGVPIIEPNLCGGGSGKVPRQLKGE